MTHDEIAAQFAKLTAESNRQSALLNLARCVCAWRLERYLNVKGHAAPCACASCALSDAYVALEKLL